MELRKGKYKREEVRKLLEDIEGQYVDKILHLKNHLDELSEQNSNLKAENDLLKADVEMVSQTLKESQKVAIEIENASRLQLEGCKKNISVFMANWNEYFDVLLEKYPYYPAIKQAELLRKEVANIFEKEVNEESLNKVKESLEGVRGSSNTFNPKSKIDDYIATTSDNGFNLDEVLNPGKLHLEDLCRELGLLDEKD